LSRKLRGQPKAVGAAAARDFSSRPLRAVAVVAMDISLRFPAQAGLPAPQAPDMDIPRH
jgi:hypothetical protein